MFTSLHESKCRRRRRYCPGGAVEFGVHRSRARYSASPRAHAAGLALCRGRGATDRLVPISTADTDLARHPNSRRPRPVLPVPLPRGHHHRHRDGRAARCRRADRRPAASAGRVGVEQDLRRTRRGEAESGARRRDRRGNAGRGGGYVRCGSRLARLPATGRRDAGSVDRDDRSANPGTEGADRAVDGHPMFGQRSRFHDMEHAGQRCRTADDGGFRIGRRLDRGAVDLRRIRRVSVRGASQRAHPRQCAALPDSADDHGVGLAHVRRCDHLGWSGWPRGLGNRSGCLCERKCGTTGEPVTHLRAQRASCPVRRK